MPPNIFSAWPTGLPPRPFLWDRDWAPSLECPSVTKGQGGRVGSDDHKHPPQSSCLASKGRGRGREPLETEERARGFPLYPANCLHTSPLGTG